MPRLRLVKTKSKKNSSEDSGKLYRPLTEEEAASFRKVGTSYQLHGESSALTTSGPFRISRNPMYLAMVIWLVGLSVLLGSLTAFLFPILLFLAANFLIIPPEERNMEQMFGEQYAKYRRHVRRWL